MTTNRIIGLVGLCLLFGFLTYPLKVAASCGAEGSRPCNVFERIPSCDAGLVENFAKGLCVAKKKPPPKPSAAALNCGSENKRPCNVLERIPSCDAGLVENFAKGLCVAKTNNSAKSSAPALNCGGANIRPCMVWERIPSCDKGLVENFATGLCAHKVKRETEASCGGVGVVPCKVWERIPSCNTGLVENFAHGRCEPGAADIKRVVRNIEAKNGEAIKRLTSFNKKATAIARSPAVTSARANTATNGRGNTGRSMNLRTPPGRVADPDLQALYDNGWFLMAEQIILDASAIVGGNYSWGTVHTLPYMDCYKNFESTAWSVGLSAGADVSVASSAWRIEEPSNFVGKSQSLTAAGSVFAGASYTVHFKSGTSLADMLDGKGLIGFSLFPQVGTGIEGEFGWGETRFAEGCNERGDFSAPPSTPWD